MQPPNATPPPGRQLSSVSSALEQRCVKGKRWDLVSAPLLSRQRFICFYFLQFCSSSEDVLNRHCVSLVLIQHSITPGSSSVKLQTFTVDSWAAQTFQLWVEFLALGYLWQKRKSELWLFFFASCSHIFGIWSDWVQQTSLSVCVLFSRYSKRVYNLSLGNNQCRWIDNYFGRCWLSLLSGLLIWNIVPQSSLAVFFPSALRNTEVS